ncbi:MAG TPA: hypothetical protein VMO47_03765, partial [Rhodothermales bacterium]|nr:hypothetical protein [Rhodothermales bacterium]
FEFDYENASPGEPLICIWTRSRAFNEGNYEDVNKHGIVTDTVRYEFEKARGHFFFPGFDTLPADGYPDPWLTVDMEYECTYRGRRAFGLEYEFIYSSEFQ